MYLICDLVTSTGIPVAIAIVLYTTIAVKMCTRRTPGNQTELRTTRRRTVNPAEGDIYAYNSRVMLLGFLNGLLFLAACITVSQFCFH